MKRIKLVISIVCILLMLFSIGAFGYSANESSFAKMTYIESCSGNINHGLVSTTVKAQVSGKSSVTSVKIKMELQKLSSGTYSTIETWEQTFSGRDGSLEKSKVTNPLSTYRLKATVTAYSSSNSETETLYAYD